MAKFPLRQNLTLDRLGVLLLPVMLFLRFRQLVLEFSVTVSMM